MPEVNNDSIQRHAMAYREFSEGLGNKLNQGILRPIARGIMPFITFMGVDYRDIPPMPKQVSDSQVIGELEKVLAKQGSGPIGDVPFGATMHFIEQSTGNHSNVRGLAEFLGFLVMNNGLSNPQEWDYKRHAVECQECIDIGTGIGNFSSWYRIERRKSLIGIPVEPHKRQKFYTRAASKLIANLFPVGPEDTYEAIYKEAASFVVAATVGKHPEPAQKLGRVLTDDILKGTIPYNAMATYFKHCTYCPPCRESWKIYGSDVQDFLATKYAMFQPRAGVK